MRNDRSFEESVQLLKQYLDCPCTFFPSGKDDGPIMDAYRKAQARGEKEGFIPMLVTVDDILLECFELNGEEKDAAQVRRELLGSPLAPGRELLAKWTRERQEEWEEDGISFDGEDEPEEDGEDGAMDRFQGYWDVRGRGTLPLVLAEIPVKHPWEIFAWLPFGGWNECPANEDHMAVAKYWFEQYGAVPAVMTHDVLEYLLPAPVSREKAAEIAREQYAYCADIVDQGVETVGRLAAILAQSDHWYFWWD